jgi:N utilization substance protein B
MAVQMLFQSDLGNTSIDSIFSDFQPWEYAVVAGADRIQAKQETRSAAASGRNHKDMGGALDYAKSLVTGTLEHLEEIDALIRQQAENWRLERMPAVDRNILRLAIYEFLYEVDVPKLVILDEAIELAKAFGSEQSGRFVNGVLDGVLKSHTLPGTLT